MKLEFEITESEYREATRWMNKRLPDRHRPLRIMGIVCATIGMLTLFTATSTNWFAPAMLILFGLFVPTYPYFVIRQYKNEGWEQYSIVGPVFWEFSDDGVRFESGLQQTFWIWEAFDRLVETHGVYLLSGLADSKPDLQASLPRRGRTSRISGFCQVAPGGDSNHSNRGISSTAAEIRGKCPIISQATIPPITSPCTSVSRRSIPLFRYVNFL